MRPHAIAAAALLLAACTREPAAPTVAWEDVTARPETFATTWAQVAGRPATFPSSWAELAGAPATFPSSWAQVEGKPAAFPVDPAAVQARVGGACAGGAAIAAIAQDGTVTCAAVRPVTVQLPSSAWTAFQCAVLDPGYGGAGGASFDGLRFKPSGGCAGVRNANTALFVPAELPAGPRPFRVQAVVTQPAVTGAARLSLGWRVPTAASGVGAVACAGSLAVDVPALPSVQDMTTLEFDFRADPALCGGPGSPLVLSFSRSDANAGELVVAMAHAVFE